MKIVIFSIIFILSTLSFASDQCEKMNVSGVQFFSPIDVVVKELGPFSKKVYFKDIETSGQHSGWRLIRPGLEVFIADIGGLTYAHVTDAKITVAGEYKVNGKAPESSGKSHVEIYPCTLPSITEQRVVLNLGLNGTIQSITIEDYGL